MTILGALGRAMRRFSRIEEIPGMKLIVDLIRCQGYAQCVFAAPDVFWLHGEEALEFDYAPDDALHEQVMRAVASCPVQAIRVGLPDTERDSGKDG